MGAPRDLGSRWNAYWGEVASTGAGGDVLWDVESREELEFYLEYMTRYGDVRLPVIDVGCGNGRVTRLLAGAFPCVVGVDVAPNAILRATLESPEADNVAFRALDMTCSGAGRALTGELGHANVFIRGVLHILAPPARRSLVENLRDVVGTSGRVMLVETSFRGDALDYLEYLGARPMHLPAPLKKAITAGLPQPMSFGPIELRDCFPDTEWHLLDGGATTIAAAASAGQTRDVPGYFAVLRAHP